MVKKYARRTGLAGVSPQTIRHMIGTNVLDAGVDHMTVAALMQPTQLRQTAIVRSVVHVTSNTPGNDCRPSHD